MAATTTATTSDSPAASKGKRDDGEERPQQQQRSSSAAVVAGRDDDDDDGDEEGLLASEEQQPRDDLLSTPAVEEEEEGEEEEENVVGNNGGSAAVSTTTTTTTTAAAAPSKVELQLSTAQMDEVLRWCLLEVTHSLVSDDQLPLDISALYSKMASEAAAVVCADERRRKLMEGGVCPEKLSAVRRGEVAVGLDVKKSSYRKLTKLFQSLVKEKVLTTKETRVGVLMVAINRSHPLYTSFTPTPDSLRRQVAAAAAAAAPSSSGAGGGAAGAAASASSSSASSSSSTASGPSSSGASSSGKQEGPQVLEFYQPVGQQTKLFTAVDIQCGKDSFFSLPEVREVMTKYIARLSSGKAAGASEFPPLHGRDGDAARGGRRGEKREEQRDQNADGFGGDDVVDKAEDAGGGRAEPTTSLRCEKKGRSSSSSALRVAASCTASSAASDHDRSASSSTVELDNLLRAVLTTKEEGRVETLSKEEVFTRWMRALQPCHAVLKPGTDIRVEPPKVVKGYCKPVKISVENRSGGRKHLTHIKGLPALYVDPNAVAEHLQRRLASAASVCRGPSKAADDVIVTVQGKMVEPVFEALTTHFAIPRAYVKK